MVLIFTFSQLIVCWSDSLREIKETKSRIKDKIKIKQFYVTERTELGYRKVKFGGEKLEYWKQIKSTGNTSTIKIISYFLSSFLFIKL